MFSISEEELRSLAESGVAGYLDRVTNRIRHDFSSELSAVSKEELRTTVETAFSRFCAQGFRRKEHLHRLIVLEVLFGPSFEVQLPKEVREIVAWTHTSCEMAEVERFWAIYRASESLVRGETHPSKDPEPHRPTRVR